MNNMELHGWIVVEVSQTLPKKLLGVIVRIIDMLIVRFEEQIIVIQTSNETVELNQEEELSMETLPWEKEIEIIFWFPLPYTTRPTPLRRHLRLLLNTNTTCHQLLQCAASTFTI